jgi:hypothetical protein
MEEARLHSHDVLIALEPCGLRDTFAGTVIASVDQELPGPDGYSFYATGDVLAACAALGLDPCLVVAIQGASTNYDGCRDTAPLGMIPTRIPGIGVLYPQFFDDSESLYAQLTAAHAFQTLQEGNKPGVSHRRGIYITRVTETDAGGREFKLLRCSTNLGGPTDNVREVDDSILNFVNRLRVHNFEESAELDHVLTQEYHNVVSEDTGKMKKASISTHSDKTKDMPRNATMAFVTFYSWKDTRPSAKPTDVDDFDLLYNGRTSVYTRLLWRLKDGVEPSAERPAEVSITLGPGSILLVSLETNRLYTHETRPSTLPVDKIPTRLSYIVRSSSTVAVHNEDGTFIKAADGALTKMHTPTEEDLVDLRAKYVRENTTADLMDYGPVLYSMNDGDYLRPLL